jgi:hypothetical protein
VVNSANVLRIAGVYVKVKAEPWDNPENAAEGVSETPIAAS